jgi:hypothetical protein
MDTLDETVYRIAAFFNAIILKGTGSKGGWS